MSYEKGHFSFLPHYLWCLVLSLEFRLLAFVISCVLRMHFVISTVCMFFIYNLCCLELRYCDLCCLTCPILLSLMSRLSRFVICTVSPCHFVISNVSRSVFVISAVCWRYFLYLCCLHTVLIISSVSRLHCRWCFACLLP